MSAGFARPTRRAALGFALSVPLALPVVALWPDAWYVALYYPAFFLALMAADLTMLLPGRRLMADIHMPRQIFLGQDANIGLNLAAEDWDRPVSIQVLLEVEGDVDVPRPVGGRLADGKLDLELALTPRRRGNVRLNALWLRWTGPLSLMEARRREEQDVTAAVVPDVRGIHEAALQFFARDAAYGVKSQLLRGEGTEFDTLREYMPGMDSRFIDWKHSARHRKLLCKEFRQERNHQIVLGFDTGHLMLEPLAGMPRLDRAIRAGLLLAWVSLFHGDLVGGCGFDLTLRHFLKPEPGMPHFARFQRFSSGLTYSTEETNFTLALAELNSRLQRRALIVLFTEFVDAISADLLLESLQWLVRRHVVVFVTMRDPLLTRLQEEAPSDFDDVARAVLADDFLRDRAVVLERIARMGVHCLDVPTSEISTALLNRYLFIKQRGLLS